MRYSTLFELMVLILIPNYYMIHILLLLFSFFSFIAAGVLLKFLLFRCYLTLQSHPLFAKNKFLSERWLCYVNHLITLYLHSQLWCNKCAFLPTTICCSSYTFLSSHFPQILVFLLPCWCSIRMWISHAKRLLCKCVFYYVFRYSMIPTICNRLYLKDIRRFLKI